MERKNLAQSSKTLQDTERNRVPWAQRPDFFLKKEIVKSRNESQVYVTNAIETDHRSYFERVRVDPPPKLIFRANKWKS